MAVSLRPTLVIGFGTSGARIVEGVQQRLYEVFRTGNLPIFQFLAIETDSRYTRDAPPRAPGGDDNFTFLPLSTGGQGDFDNFEHLLQQLRRQGLDPAWISPDVARRIRALGQGAGGARVAGRLILWANLERVRREIERLKARAVNQASRDQTERVLAERFDHVEIKVEGRPMVIVCGTSTGGSFSGACIDLGYLCREALQIDRDEDLYAVTLLPPRAQLVEADAPKKANAYAALVEAEYFRGSDTVYEEHWPNTPLPVRRPEAPYGYTYYISQDYGSDSTNPIADVGGLCQIAALKVFCDLIGLEGSRGAGLVDHWTSYPNARNFTFGLAAVVHPRYQLAEHAACELGTRLCDRWLDTQVYQDPSDKARQVPGAERLTEQAARVWEGTPGRGFTDGLLSSYLDRLGSAEGRDLSIHDRAEALVEDLRDGRDTLRHSLVDSGATLYGIVHENLARVRQALAADLEAEVHRELERTQNLAYATAYARAFGIVVEQTTQLWNRLGIPDSDDGWSTRVADELVPPIRRAASETGRNLVNLATNRRQVCLGMVLEAVDELKQFQMQKVLRDVRGALEALVERLERHRRMLERARAVLRERQQRVEGQLRDHTVPIVRVWSRGRLEDDLAALAAEFPHPGARDLAGVAYAPEAAPPSRWIAETLGQWHDRGVPQRGNHAEVRGDHPAEEIKQQFQRQVLDRVDALLPVDLSARLYDREMEVFDRVQRGHLRYSDHGTRSIVVKSSYLLGAEHATRARREEADARLGRVHALLSLPGMDHALLFYHEEYIREIDQLRELALMRHHFQTPPAGASHEEREHWGETRDAYGVMDRLRREQLRKDLENLFRLVGDLFVTWRRSPHGMWQPLAVRDAVELPISVGQTEGGRLAVRWEVTAERRLPRWYDIVATDGEPVTETVSALANDPDVRVPEGVLEQGRAEVRRLGTVRIDDLWKNVLRDGFEERYDDQKRAARVELYFGRAESTGQAPGLIRRIIAADPARDLF